MKSIHVAKWAIACSFAWIASGCANEDPQSCPPDASVAGLGPSGRARVFKIDPATGSGLLNIGPSSAGLDDLAAPRTLERLGGTGRLSGQWMDVRTNQNPKCEQAYGAFSSTQDFSVPFGKPPFQESMVYYYGDYFRSDLASRGFLKGHGALRGVAHCEAFDNAYYLKGQDSSGNPVEFVCFGDSTSGDNRSYADDGMVVLHEIQHAHTTHQYSDVFDLNALVFDDAGALNEALSDFMALYYSRPFVAPEVDPKVFSRWALGLFFPTSPARRGAHRCAEYDDQFPGCGHPVPFSSDHRSWMQYKFPDGLGWPYSYRTATSGKLSEVFRTFAYQEEIHTLAPLMTGALWDVAEALGFDDRIPAVLMAAIQLLPKPSSISASPVTWVGFAEAMMTAAAAVGLSSTAQQTMQQVFESRGLLHPTPAPSGWAHVPTTSSFRVEDHAVRVKSWLSAVGGKRYTVKNNLVQSDGQLDPGETAAVWFNIENTSNVTAGSLELTIRPVPGASTSASLPVHLLGTAANWGSLGTDRAQIRYSKVNGTDIVAALQSNDLAYHVPTGNNYFLTNPFFNRSYRTALWVVVQDSVPSPTVARFEVRIKASNAPDQTLYFEVPVRAGSVP